MRKFKNKKLASLLVVFLLVFVMSGAFALFQTILDVRGRVNMFAPAIDAIIANVTPVAAPLGFHALDSAPGGLAVVLDPHGVHDSNPPVGGPWMDGITARYNARVFGSSLGEHIPAVTGGTQFDAWQTLAAMTNREISPAAAQITPTAAMRAVSSWAWSYQTATAGSPDSVLPGADDYLRPNPNRVVVGNIANPADFRRVYLDLTFDNFNQFYVFEVDLANVGNIDLEVTEIEITRVIDDSGDPAPTLPADASPLSNFRFLDDGTEHPRWAELSTAINNGLAGLFNITVDASHIFLAADSADRTSSNGNILLQTPDPTATTTAGPWDTQAYIDDMRAARNTEFVTLRFCVALQNWHNFLEDWDVAAWASGWGSEVVDGFPAEVTDEVEALEYLLNYLFNNALTSTFRITYTVVPYQYAGFPRLDTGVFDDANAPALVTPPVVPTP